MPAYLSPGVYIEEIPSGVRPIEAVGTSTAAILGYAFKGPLNEPTLIFNRDQYEEEFGGIRDLGAVGDEMGHTVQAVFLNGGTKAYIVRLASGTLTAASGGLLIPIVGAANSDVFTDSLNVTAVNEGTWADGLEARLSFVDQLAAPDLTLGYKLEIGRTVDGDFTPQETFSGFSLDSADPNFLEDVVNGVSQLVTVKLDSSATILAAAKRPYFLGTITSEDLAGLDVAGLDGKKLKVALDGGTANDVTLSDTPSPLSSLADVAAQIQSAVRGSVTTNPRKDFTCVVEGTTLVLTSGGRTKTSAVAVTAGTPAADDAAALLKLSTAASVKKTGEQSFVATLSATPPPGTEATLAGGADGAPPTQTEYQDAFAEFLKIRDVNIICLPGQNWSTDATSASRAIIDEAVAHAAKMKNRMVIIDPPPDVELTTEKQIKDLGFPAKTYAVLYYPWVEVANPYYDAEKKPGNPKTLPIPPSGFAAGMWAKIDARRGVWKAPAGLGTGLIGVAKAQYVVGADEQDQLNPWGVNAFRKIISETVIWGSRTLATKADPEWRYVPVRRTAILIEESVYQGIQWAVFEPNNHLLWSSLRLNIGAFMDRLFRAGAFQGEKASDAYFVRCGLGDTMKQADIDAGQVIVIVGFAPLKPAEFVIVRIQQMVGQQ